MNDVTAKAKVNVTIEVSIPHGWSKDCAIGQLHDQAAKEAKGQVLGLITGQGGLEARQNMRIIGEPEVTGVITAKNE